MAVAASYHDRSETEEFIASCVESGGVILGRGGQVVLRDRPGVLHVFLGGPREARIRQGMELYHLRIDSTALDLDTVVDLIVAASQSRMRQANPVGHS